MIKLVCKHCESDQLVPGMYNNQFKCLSCGSILELYQTKFQVILEVVKIAGSDRSAPIQRNFGVT